MQTPDTPAIQAMKASGLPFSLRAYRYDPDDLRGTRAAQLLQLDADRVFKTLVLKSVPLGPLVCCLPVADTLDMEALMRASGALSLSLLHLKALPGLTGYIRGGVSPLGMRCSFPTFLDERALQYDEISVSAGRRGLQLILRPQHLIEALRPTLCSLAKRGEQS